jgi:hypothetical protein
MGKTRGNIVRIGCCISGHGFGHATRAIAVMQALAERQDVCFEIVTPVPPWLFAQSLTAPHAVHPLETDVGLAQRSVLDEDLPATLEALDHFYPLSTQRIEQAAALFAGCRLVLCDIAPLGILAAKRASIPSVLVENFTWDWIYGGYVERWPRVQPHIDLLAALFAQADHHLQAKPVCCPHPCDRVVEPVARRFRHPETVRPRLCCGPDQRLLLLTMGGVCREGQGRGAEIALAPLLRRPDLVVVLPGRSRENEFSENLRFLAQDGPWYHPDLMAAADLVVGKVGYSTVAEAYHAQTPFAYVGRRGFRESASLEAFVDSHLYSWKIEEQELQSGQWLDRLPPLPLRRQPPDRSTNGADQVAEYLLELLQRTNDAAS